MVVQYSILFYIISHCDVSMSQPLDPNSVAEMVSTVGCVLHGHRLIDKCLADISWVFGYELNTVHCLFQAFERDQLATIIIFILKVKIQTNEAQKGSFPQSHGWYMLESVVKPMLIWLQNVLL